MSHLCRGWLCSAPPVLFPLIPGLVGAWALQGMTHLIVTEGEVTVLPDMLSRYLTYDEHYHQHLLQHLTDKVSIQRIPIIPL